MAALCLYFQAVLPACLLTPCFLHLRQQRKYILRERIGLGKHGYTGLLRNQGRCQVTGRSRIISVHKRRPCRGDIRTIALKFSNSRIEPVYNSTEIRLRVVQSVNSLLNCQYRQVGIADGCDIDVVARLAVVHPNSGCSRSQTKCGSKTCTASGQSAQGNRSDVKRRTEHALHILTGSDTIVRKNISSPGCCISSNSYVCGGHRYCYCCATCIDQRDCESLCSH